MQKRWFLLSVVVVLMLVWMEIGQHVPVFVSLPPKAQAGPRALDDYIRVGYREFDLFIWDENDRMPAEGYVRAAREVFPDVPFDVKIVISSDEELATGELRGSRVVIRYNSSSGKGSP